MVNVGNNSYVPDILHDGDTPGFEGAKVVKIVLKAAESVRTFKNIEI